MRRYASAQARLEHAGGYDWRTRHESVLRGLGFRTEDLDRALTTFSGGELTRASLARSLSGDPDLLLLDEPTNHLDVASIEWLETELASLDAAIILVAHDRWFIGGHDERRARAGGRALAYFAGPGTWRVWRRRRARCRGDLQGAHRGGHRPTRALRRAIPLQEVEGQAGAGEAHADRPLVQGARERQASSTGCPRGGVRSASEFLKPARSGRVVVEAEGVDVTVPGRTLAGDVSFALERGDHVGLVGPNGAGKTTLLETLLGLRAPATAGSVRLGYGVQPAYFSQHEVELDERGSVLDCAQRETGLSRPQAQALLGRFLFSG